MGRRLSPRDSASQPASPFRRDPPQPSGYLPTFWLCLRRYASADNWVSRVENPQ